MEVKFEPYIHRAPLQNTFRMHRTMTRPFFSRDRISDFDIFDRHTTEAIAIMKQRFEEGYPVDFQVSFTRHL